MRKKGQIAGNLLYKSIHSAASGANLWRRFQFKRHHFDPMNVVKRRADVLPDPGDIPPSALCDDDMGGECGLVFLGGPELQVLEVAHAFYRHDRCLHVLG